MDSRPAHGRPRAALWGICGGLNSDGRADEQTAECPADEVCVRSDRYYWQCQQNRPGVEKRIKAQERHQEVRAQQQREVEEARRRGRPKVPLWNPCGGINGPGGRDAQYSDCVPGAVCRRLDRWARGGRGERRC
jgi:hypothetical protein